VLVGTIGSPRRAQVDGSGRLTLNVGTVDEIVIGWWIGAEDRWYVPEREITIRQTLVQGSPVVMTSVRIPGGDATHTVFGALQGPRELAVVDVADRARAPFVCALTFSGPGCRRVSVEGNVVRVDGFALVTLPRPPMRTATAADLVSLEALVFGGGASEGIGSLADASGGDAAALLVPVSQGSQIRFAVLLGASSAVALNGTPVLSSLPDVHTAASGWGVHVARGPRLTVPDREVGARVQAAVGGALLAAEPAIGDRALPTLTAAVLARSFDRIGLLAEAGALLEDLGKRQSRKGLIDDDALTTAHALDAIALHAQLSRDPVFASTFVPVAAAGVEALVKIVRKGNGPKELLGGVGRLGRLFALTGDDRAAQQVRELSARFSVSELLPAVPLPPLPPSSAGGSFVPEEHLRLADFIEEAADAVASVRADDSVDLFPRFDPAWRGSSFDVRHVAVPGGRLSAAVRWHGARAALLWEVDGLSDVTITCRSIDPQWSATGRGADALLG
jgi:hypothetical protein